MARQPGGENRDPDPAHGALYMPIIADYTLQRGQAWCAPPHPLILLLDNGPWAEFWSGINRLELVTTEHWAAPTEFNTTPLSAIGSGRGSLVLYNQGSAFHWMLTGHQYMEAAIQAFGSREALAEAMMVHAKEALGLE
jgi:hypothetical protein